MLSRYLFLEICWHVLTSDLEVVLLSPHSEKSLASMVLYPDFVPYVNLFGSGIATALLRVYLAILLFVILSYPSRGSTDI